ncbi:hypothetical protein BY996DRAFT_6761188 [Phakopsora pachyrhizi]|nr:hypothetical protein BY996DRAFT_6761188 [Phakopsora pachyrhizi]
MYKILGSFLVVCLSFGCSRSMNDWFPCSLSFVHDVEKGWICVNKDSPGHTVPNYKSFPTIRNGVCVDANDESILAAIDDSDVVFLPYTFKDCTSDDYEGIHSITQAKGYVMENDHIKIISLAPGRPRKINSKCPVASNMGKIMKCHSSRAHHPK